VQGYSQATDDEPTAGWFRFLPGRNVSVSRKTRCESVTEILISDGSDRLGIYELKRRETAVLLLSLSDANF
jgi:hypothetical protein